MELGKTDLKKLLKKLKTHKLDFKTFFPVFRDTILGLVFMHSDAIAHRDIKPGNILLMKSGEFTLADYGEGVNLAGEEKYNENDHNFMVGKWELRGTVPYFAPALR